MKISIGADHRGFELKKILMAHLQDVQLHDVGTYDDQRTDYPLFAKKVCNDIKQGVAQAGILVCGSGIGISVAANRYKGIYAALCWNTEVAKRAKEHDGANVLVLPADFITADQALEIVRAWQSATFKKGIYQERLAMLDEL